MRADRFHSFISIPTPRDADRSGDEQDPPRESIAEGRWYWTEYLTTKTLPSSNNVIYGMPSSTTESLTT